MGENNNDHREERLNMANQGWSTLSSDITDTDETLSVESVEPFPEAPFLISIGHEILEVTEINGNQFTVERGQEDTPASPHSEGALVENRFTAGTYNNLASMTEFMEHVEAETDVHGLGPRPPATRDDEGHVTPSNFYLDYDNGDDENSGEVPAEALKTWGELMKKIPRSIFKPITIWIIGNYPNALDLRTTYTYDREYLQIKGYTGTASNHSIPGAEVMNCQGGGIDGIVFKDLRFTDTVWVSTCVGVKFRDVELMGGASAMWWYSSIGIVRDFNVGTDEVTDGITAHTSSVMVRDGSGSATRYGVRAMHASIISLDGSMVTGGTRNVDDHNGTALVLAGGFLRTDNLLGVTDENLIYFGDNGQHIDFDGKAFRIKMAKEPEHTHTPYLLIQATGMIFYDGSGDSHKIFHISDWVYPGDI